MVGWVRALALTVGVLLARGVQPQFRAVVWAMGSRTVMLGGNEFTDEEIVEIASSLRPPTEAEWGAMTAPLDGGNGPIAEAAVDTTVPA